MLYLKEANIEDIEKEYKAIIQIPKNENGYINEYYGCSKEEFEQVILPRMIEYSKGINIPPNKVQNTYYFLWDDNTIVGLFKIRHYLNDFLREGPGHIGYGIIEKFRNKGYATKGLALAIEICKNIIKENEIYLSVHKDNPISLKVQKNNEAYIVAENEKEYFTRIKIREGNNDKNKTV